MYFNVITNVSGLVYAVLPCTVLPIIIIFTDVSFVNQKPSRFRFRFCLALSMRILCNVRRRTDRVELLEITFNDRLPYVIFGAHRRISVENHFFLEGANLWKQEWRLLRVILHNLIKEVNIARDYKIALATPFPHNARERPNGDAVDRSESLNSQNTIAASAFCKSSTVNT